uniref:Uncharacterized protein n=1 Tax=Anguilla anguilla TaxID=7936 RepID=A0A0E9S258_ANGAN
MQFLCEFTGREFITIDYFLC